MNRKMVILTEGPSNPRTAKTACSVIRYRPDEVVAVLDSTQVGKTTQEVLQVGGVLPFIRDLAEAGPADTLLVGIAPPGGKIPASWRAIIVNALTQGMDVISGLHEFLGDDTEFAKVATQSGAKIWDVRKNDEKEIAQCFQIGHHFWAEGNYSRHGTANVIGMPSIQPHQIGCRLFQQILNKYRDQAAYKLMRQPASLNSAISALNTRQRRLDLR